MKAPHYYFAGNFGNMMIAAAPILAVMLISFDVTEGMLHNEMYKIKVQQTPLRFLEIEDDNTGQSSGHSVIQGEVNKGSIASPMIVNGYEVTGNEYPFLLSLQMIYQNYKRYHICSAILIATNKALTAAHCAEYLYYYDHYVAVGYNRLSQKGQALIKVEDFVIHSRYNDQGAGFPNDVAILTLAKHVTLNDKVQLANLASKDDPQYNDYPCFVAGWGMTEDYGYPDELRSAFLLGISNRMCTLFLKVFRERGLVRSKQKCAWYWPFSACYGDSGGPLVCNNQVVGILSWSADCTGCYPLVFARVAKYRRWIKRNI